MHRRAVSTPISGAHRLIRGWLAAIIATTFAALSHGWAAPIVIEPALLLLALVFAAPITVLLAKHKFTPWLTTGSVLASQAIFHTVFMAAPHGAHATLAEAHHCGPITTLGDAGAGAMMGHSGNIFEMALAHATVGMITAHLIAAAGTITLLCYGEELLSALIALVSGWRTCHLLQWQQPTPAPAASSYCGHTIFVSPALRQLAAVLSYRGPPALACAN